MLLSRLKRPLAPLLSMLASSFSLRVHQLSSSPAASSSLHLILFPSFLPSLIAVISFDCARRRPNGNRSIKDVSWVEISSFTIELSFSVIASKGIAFVKDNFKDFGMEKITVQMRWSCFIISMKVSKFTYFFDLLCIHSRTLI